MSPTIAVIVGTRPEVIKMAPVYRRLQAAESLNVKLISTGQHRDMSRQALDAFELQPDVDLDLMTHAQSVGEFAARALSALTRTFTDLDPEVVLVHGDTTTTLAASLAAFYLRKRVGHVEAGMRTGNLQSPWPEEMHRRLTAPLCHWHFVPIARNLQELVREGIAANRCFLTGNTAIDALLWMRDRLRRQPPDMDQLQARLGVSSSFFDYYFAHRAGRLILVTGHRRESHGQGIEDLCAAILKLVTAFPDLGILFPVHLNPQVKDVAQVKLANHPRIALTKPLDYRDFVWVMQHCFAIVSDSGGIQCEAISLNKPLLVTREITEYPEAVECGGCQLVGTHPDKILAAASNLLTDPQEYSRRSYVANPYGNGQAADKIVQVLQSEI